jgi:hypothetical protein
MSPRKSNTDPQILEMPAQKMAIVQGKGAPDKVFSEVMPALYGSAYTLKFDLKKKRAAHLQGERATRPLSGCSPRSQG